MSKQRYFIALLSEATASTVGIYGFGKTEDEALAMPGARATWSEPDHYHAAECSRRLYEYLRLAETADDEMSTLKWAHNGALFDLVVPNDPVIAEALAEMEGTLETRASSFIGEVSSKDSIRDARSAFESFADGRLHRKITGDVARIALIVAAAERIESAVAEHNADEARRAMKGCADAGHFFRGRTTAQASVLLAGMGAITRTIPAWEPRVMGEAIAVLEDGAVIGWSGSPDRIGDIVAHYSPEIMTVILTVNARVRNDKAAALNALDLGEFGAYIFDDEIHVFERDDAEEVPLKLPVGFPVEHVPEMVRAFRTGVRRGEIRGTLFTQRKIQDALGL